MKTLYIYGTVYMNGKTIQKSIESLLPLTKKFNLYLSIIDNFSTDNTYEWLMSSSNKYKNVTFYVKQIKCNRGKGREIALNHILNIAKPNDFTFYIDFDTIYTRKIHKYIINFVNERDKNKIGIGHLSLIKYNYGINWKNLNYGEDIERGAHFKYKGYKIYITPPGNSFGINQDRGNSLKERERVYAKGLKYYIRLFSNAIDTERGFAFKNFPEFYKSSKIKSKFRLLVFYFAYLIARIKGIYSYSNKDNYSYILSDK